MKSYPLVSVVTITYGHQDYILDTINGVLMQKYNGPIEFIIANDNSPDETDQVIQQFLRYTNVPANIEIKYTKHELNKGVCDNFVWALEQAKGEYLAFCEGDDYWIDPLKLQKQVDFLQSHPSHVLCFTSRIIEDVQGSPVESIFPSKEWTKDEIYKEGVIFPLQSILAVNHNIDLVFFLHQFNPIFGVDKLLSYYYSLLGNVESLLDITAVYRHNGRGVWSKLSPTEKLDLHISESHKFYDKIISLKLDSSVNKMMLVNYLHIRVLRNILNSQYDKCKLFIRILRREKISLLVLIYVFKCYLKGIVRRIYSNN